MALTLPLKKEGDVAPKLSLNLDKGAKFSVELFWESEHDLDGHALLATNNGFGAKITDMAQVLSTYNPGLPLADGSASSRKSGDKRPFMTPCGSLRHSGDARTGIGATVDEIITIDGSLIPPGVNEIPIFVTIHPTHTAKFSQVTDAGIRIKDESGKILGEYILSNQFGEFDAVQMGSLILGANGWSYEAAGSGFNGDFNAILGYFQ
ncbi:MAG: TerD family protein [Candidatus Moranbacteria bacterium]|nr:TerD family protein [Candidatus Moranbacteria bacterium]